MSKIKLTPEGWSQPGDMRYTYRHNMEKTLWNASSCTSQEVFLWTIDAWGRTHSRIVQRINFDRDYAAHTAPSLYEQMRAAT